ncbi:MAG TPA: hypothetical protein VFA07_04910 [Chthonomonadaceae bacterium]|nr:hypothetical protein [Chthonomonadaceae bacterium]
MDDQLDPLHKMELALLRAEHQKRYQALIAYLKEKVGEGIEYRNDVVRVVVSDAGAYYELNDLPEEFSGAVGDQVERHFLAPQEAVALLKRAIEATQEITPENTRQLSILVLYTRRGLVDRKNCYVFDYHPEARNTVKPLEIGQFQPDVMPLFFKIKIDADFGEAAVGMPCGILFCMANAGDRHLLIRIPYQGDQVVDLGNLSTSTTVH